MILTTNSFDRFTFEALEYHIFVVTGIQVIYPFG